MKPRNAILPLFVAATFVASTAAAQHTPDSLRIECWSVHRPTQRAVAQALHIDNFAAAYDTRDRIVQIARRKCLSGATDVDTVAAPDTSTDATQAHAGKHAHVQPWD